MLCPYCRATNADKATKCVGCGADFSLSDDALTLGGDATSTPSGGQAAPSSERVAPHKDVAAGVLTPPPSGISPPGSPGPGTHVSAVATSALGGMGLRPGGDFGPRYRIEKLLGEGGMGAVYKAYDKELDRVVALKTLRSGLSGNPELTQRFKQELLLASRISHKNILRIHDMGDVEGVKFITMAFVEGEDLYGMLRREGKLAPDRLVRIARQLCAALDSAHSEGVIHRDLKPQNVLLDKNENVYVSDFGLAKSLEADAIGMTRTGEFLGTPRYMSPEQVENKPLDNRSDLYSLGLILYEMAAGDVPFTGNSALQVMYMRVKEKPKSPRKANPELPDYLERIIMRCLERDPSLRYQSAAEILADIDQNRASSAPASLILSRSIAAALPTKESGTRKWWVAAGMVMVLVVVVFTVPAVRQRIFSPVVTQEGVPLGDLRYVAVLPFRTTGDAAGLEHISTGLTEALGAKLFQLKEVRLASAAAVGGIPADMPLDRIGRQLGVNLIVQGTVQTAGERIRVIVNLEDVRAQRRLFSQDFSGLTQDLLTLEDQIYNRLVEALELRPSSEELARTSARPTENIEAYDLYLRGRNAMRGSHDVASLEEAIRQFEEAQRKDPNFALAYTGLADASLQLYREKKDQAYATRALGAAQQAQRLNDNLPEVHNVLGSIYQATGRTAEALAELRRAIDLAPNSDEAHRRLGAAYAAAGRKDEAIASFDKAVQINPFLWVNHNALGGAHLNFGENEKALAAFSKVTEIEPENPVGHENTGNTHLRMGNFAAAIAPYQRAIQIQPHYSTYSNLGTAFFYLDRYNEAVTAYEKAVEMNPNESIAAGNLADAYRAAGQRDKALAAYDKAIALAFKELQVNPRSASTLGSLALYYAKKGDGAQAIQFIRRARAVDPNDVNLMYTEAVAHATAGRNKEALAALRAALEKGYPAEVASSDTDLGDLRKLPEFQQIIRQFTAPK